MPQPGVALERLGFLTIGLFDGQDPGPGHQVTLEMIELGERLGFDSAWVRHRHLQYGISSPVAVLAAAAQRTSRIELGTAVIPLGWENPLRLAEDLATVDILSGGRLNPGFSVGPPRHWEDVREALYPDTWEHEDFSYLASVFNGRADLEDELGHRETAVQFGRIALRLRYIYDRDPGAIATDHYNLAIYLRKLGAEPVEHRAHRLAAGLIAGLTGMADRFHAAIDGLAADLHEEIGPTPIPSSLAEVTYWVEESDGVRFGTLVASLATEPEAAEALLSEILTTARNAAIGGSASPW